MKFLVLLFASLGLLVSSVSGFTLKIVEGSYTWQEAKADAEARGGRLAVLNSQERIDLANAYLSTLSSWNNLWIGLTDEVTEGDWKWITGEELTDSFWVVDEPSNGGTSGNEHYAHYWAQEGSTTPIGWNDRADMRYSPSGTDSMGYLLETVPEPSSYALLLGGLALGLVALRRQL